MFMFTAVSSMELPVPKHRDRRKARGIATLDLNNRALGFLLD
jgi:hypothetical protein